MTDGIAIRDYVVAHPVDTTVNIESDRSVFNKPEWEDILASFSSVGPNGDPNVLKPDISAPGVNILSAYSEASDWQYQSHLWVSRWHQYGCAARDRRCGVDPPV